MDPMEAKVMKRFDAGILIAGDLMLIVGLMIAGLHPTAAVLIATGLVLLLEITDAEDS